MKPVYTTICVHCKGTGKVENCGNCAHFYQHYILSGSIFTKCNAGHCTEPRLKNRTPTDRPCERWALHQ